MFQSIVFTLFTSKHKTYSKQYLIQWNLSWAESLWTKHSFRIFFLLHNNLINNWNVFKIDYWKRTLFFVLRINFLLLYVRYLFQNDTISCQLPIFYRKWDSNPRHMESWQSVSCCPFPPRLWRPFLSKQALTITILFWVYKKKHIYVVMSIIVRFGHILKWKENVSDCSYLFCFVFVFILILLMLYFVIQLLYVSKLWEKKLW